MVARVSEYLYTSKSEHWLTTERVQFELPDGTLVPAQHAHKHVHTGPMAVHIHVKTRNNDQKGRGHTLHFHRANSTDKYCYVSEMWAHAKYARPIPNCPFFAIPDIESPAADTSIKKHGSLPRHRLHPHINKIMRIGAWRSATFLTYIRENSHHMFEKARAALAGSDAMTLSDVKRLDTANTTQHSTTGLSRPRI